MKGSECNDKCIEKREEETKKDEKWNIEADTGQENFCSIERGAFYDPAHFLFHAKRRESKSEYKHIDEINSCCDLESDDYIGEGIRAQRELMIQNGDGAALNKPDETEKSKPGHTARIAKKSDNFFAEESIEWP